MNDRDATFDTTEHPGTRVLAVTGEIDLAMAARFAEELTALIAGTDGMSVIDLSGVTFIDSSGVRELLKAKRQAEMTKKQLLLLNPSPSCRRVLEVSGVWNEFAVEETPAERDVRSHQSSARGLAARVSLWIRHEKHVYIWTPRSSASG